MIMLGIFLLFTFLPLGYLILSENKDNRERKKKKEEKERCLKQK